MLRARLSWMTRAACSTSSLNLAASMAHLGQQETFPIDAEPLVPLQPLPSAHPCRAGLRQPSTPVDASDQRPSSPALRVSGRVHTGDRGAPAAERFSLAHSSLRVGG